MATVKTQNFKTRTILKEKENPCVDGQWPLAIDIGYSAVKGMSPNSVYSFPFYARKVTNQLLGIGESKDEDIMYKNEKGEIWRVGTSAQDMIGTDDSNESSNFLYGRHRYTSPMFLVCARVGMAFGMMKNEYGSPENKQIHVQTGLPPAYIKQDSAWLREALAGEHCYQVKIGKNPWTKFKFALPESNISIMPQPMGTLLSIATDAKGNFIPDAKKYFHSNILIFDPGFGTLDVFNIKNQIIDSTETFDDLGMKRVLEETSQGIFDEYRVDVPVPNMQKILGEGVVRCFERKANEKPKLVKKPFAEILNKCSEKVCNEALEKLNTNYNYLTDHDYLVITGGTGAAWAEMIRDYYKDIETLQIISGNQNDSLPYIFSNVRGYYMALYGTLKKMQR